MCRAICAQCARTAYRLRARPTYSTTTWDASQCALSRAQPRARSALRVVRAAQGGESGENREAATRASRDQGMSRAAGFCVTLPITVTVAAHPNAIPRSRPTNDATTAIKAASPASISRCWARVSPSARSRAFSRIRSRTDRLNVLLTPNQRDHDGETEQPGGDHQHDVESAVQAAALDIAALHVDPGAVARGRCNGVVDRRHHRLRVGSIVDPKPHAPDLEGRTGRVELVHRSRGQHERTASSAAVSARTRTLARRWRDVIAYRRRCREGRPAYCHGTRPFLRRSGLEGPGPGSLRHRRHRRLATGTSDPAASTVGPFSTGDRTHPIDGRHLTHGCIGNHRRRR